MHLLSFIRGNIRAKWIFVFFRYVLFCFRRTKSSKLTDKLSNIIFFNIYMSFFYRVIFDRAMMLLIAIVFFSSFFWLLWLISFFLFNVKRSLLVLMFFHFIQYCQPTILTSRNYTRKQSLNSIVRAYNNRHTTTKSINFSIESSRWLEISLPFETLQF